MRESREVMNLRQASHYLGVSPDTLYRYICTGLVPAFKLGSRWKFRKSVLDRWMEDEMRQSRTNRRREPLGRPLGAARGQKGEANVRHVKAKTGGGARYRL